jgi:hypothetical protein
MSSVILQFAFIVFLPAAVSVGSTYLARQSIARPWWFLLTVTLILYVAYVVLFYLIAAPIVGGFDFSKGKDGSTVQVRSHMPNLLSFYAKPLVVFFFVAVLIVIGLFRLFRK